MPIKQNKLGTFRPNGRNCPLLITFPIRDSSITNICLIATLIFSDDLTYMLAAMVCIQRSVIQFLGLTYASTTTGCSRPIWSYYMIMSVSLFYIIKLFFSFRRIVVSDWPKKIVDLKKFSTFSCSCLFLCCCHISGFSILWNSVRTSDLCTVEWAYERIW